MMNYKFDIQPIRRFAGQNVMMKFPKEIACFSYDDHHQLHLDDSSIKYYFTPEIGADLSKGFDSFEKLDDTVDGHIDSLLKSLLDLEQKMGKKVEANFITWRGMMTKLMGAIFSDLDGFEMNATLFDVGPY